MLASSAPHIGAIAYESYHRRFSVDDSHGSRPAREPTDRDGGVPVKPRPTPAAPNDLTTARTSRVHKIIIFVLLFAATLVVFLGLSAGQMPVRMQEFPASWERVASQELELKTKSASERTGISRLSSHNCADFAGSQDHNFRAALRCDPCSFPRPFRWSNASPDAGISRQLGASCQPGIRAEDQVCK